MQYSKLLDENFFWKKDHIIFESGIEYAPNEIEKVKKYDGETKKVIHLLKTEFKGKIVDNFRKVFDRET